MERYFSAGLAASTSRVYSAGINKYLFMCHELSILPTPASEHLLCKFVTYLALNNISSNTIKVYLSGVRQLHIQDGLPPPPTTAMPKLAQVLKGIKTSQAETQPQSSWTQCLPITPEILCRIKAYWQQDPPSQDRIMLWAAFLTCFFGFFQSGEICTEKSESFDPSAELSVESVKVDNIVGPQVVWIWLSKSKSDQVKEGATINLLRMSDDLCPVAALLTWLIYRGNSPGPLFLFSSGSHLTHATFVGELQKATLGVGLDPNHYSGHSFCRGAATTAAASSILDSHIKLLGRWRSAAFQVYLKPSDHQMANLAARLSKQPPLVSSIYLQPQHP